MAENKRMSLGHLLDFHKVEGSVGRVAVEYPEWGEGKKVEVEMEDMQGE